MWIGVDYWHEKYIEFGALKEALGILMVYSEFWPRHWTRDCFNVFVF